MIVVSRGRAEADPQAEEEHKANQAELIYGRIRITSPLSLKMLLFVT